MASDKSFPATQRKLDKARQDGDVAKSSLFSGAIILSIGILYIFYSAFSLYYYVIRFLTGLRLTEDFSSNNMLEYAEIAIERCSGFLATFFGLLFVVAAAVECWQVGFYFSLKPLAINFSKLNPIEGFKKNILKHSEHETLMLGLLIEILKMLAVLVSSIVVWLILLQKYSALFVPNLSFKPSMYFIMTYVASVMCLILFQGVADYLHLRFKRAQRLKMDANEFKREMRESEGDPHLKGMRKQLHQEIGMRTAIDAVRKAKVLLVGRQDN